jgi:GT2 family glycosyltransferase
VAYNRVLSGPQITVVIPTLAADPTLTDCLRSLAGQSFSDFQVIVIDNSGADRADALVPDTVRERTTVIRNKANVGFGEAVNQGIRATNSEFVAVLNDDAVAQADWLRELHRTLAEQSDIGMAASQVRIAGTERLDSAGMLIAIDGSSKQRGHDGRPDLYLRREEALLPSGSAALYRRQMLDDVGLFDSHYFLYCEDTDLGLRARRKAWGCLYVPGAIVEHRYSHSAGRASSLKAYYVERNRIYTAVRNLPWHWILLMPVTSAVRYFWHGLYAIRGRGKAAEHLDSGGGVLSLAGAILRAHAAAIVALPRLLKERQQIMKSARLGAKQFSKLLLRHRISLRQVASL